ncbi:MAG: peptide chain release factor N(5)-glutamine methyltransferase [Clostridia bacterium]|nr:peptide chain release factor N(5)-glutamine methyltransferase [Clostridia bacterium]
MTLSDVRRRLTDAGIGDADAEARLLFSHVSGLPAHRLIGGDPVCDDPRLNELLQKRLARVPLAYLLGETAFFRETYRVTPDVLIPRPDTERLVEEAIARVPRGARIADLCCGSGCIGISTLASRPDLTCDAIDLSPAAVALTRENAKRNGVSSRLSATCADLFALPAEISGYGAILSNPPYIARAVIPTLSPEVRSEPRAALDGGEDGLAFYREIARRLPSLLIPGGIALLEIGYDQADAVARIFSDEGFSATILPDYAGNPRVAVLSRV